MPKRVVHFQCLKHDDRKETEEAGLKREGKLADDDELIVIEAFKEPTSRGFMDLGPTHVTIGGSGWSVWEDIPHIGGLREAVGAAFDWDIPILGICFGAQFLADLYGGKVIRDVAREERGTTEIVLSRDGHDDALFGSLPERFAVQSSHHDRISQLPTGACRLASSQRGVVIQGFGFRDARVWGVQFHPERCRQDVERLIRPETCDYEPRQVQMVKRTLADSPHAGRVLERFFSL